MTGGGTTSEGPYTVNGSSTYYPLNYYSGTITCSGISSCFPNETNSGPYTQGTFNSIGTLYDTVAILVIGGAIVGFTAATLALSSRGRGSRWATGLALVAILLVAVAPTILFVGQPAVVSSQAPKGSGVGPQSSFFGSCSGTGCNYPLPQGTTFSASWGPSTGWYLALGALVPLIAGLLLSRKKGSRQTETSVYNSGY